MLHFAKFFLCSSIESMQEKYTYILKHNSSICVVFDVKKKNSSIVFLDCLQIEALGVITLTTWSLNALDCINKIYAL